MADLLGVFGNAIGRPSTVTGSKYNQVSNQFWNSVHDVLAAKAKPEDSLNRLEGALNRIGHTGKWD
jgi:trehalose/maltose transport system substrate-binding protein